MNTKNIPNQRYPIGTQFVKIGRIRQEPWTVTDYLITTNLKGEIVQTRYVATQKLMNQIVTDRDIVETTIARGLIKGRAKCSK